MGLPAPAKARNLRRYIESSIEDWWTQRVESSIPDLQGHQNLLETIRAAQLYHLPVQLLERRKYDSKSFVCHARRSNLVELAEKMQLL
jgi:hypothetical protein